jgi:general stress protein 26
MKKSIVDVLDYDLLKNKLLSFLENKESSLMILATSSNDVVMARSVLVCNEDLDLYLFTWKYSRKCTQIKHNNLVSLCKDKVEIEGTAKILGLLTSNKNNKILNLLKQRFPDAIKIWENKSSMVIIKVTPIFARVDGYFIDDDSFNEYIDISKQYAFREKWAYH